MKSDDRVTLYGKRSKWKTVRKRKLWFDGSLTHVIPNTKKVPCFYEKFTFKENVTFKALKRSKLLRIPLGITAKNKN